MATKRGSILYEIHEYMITWMEEHDIVAKSKIMDLGPDGKHKENSILTPLAESLNTLGEAIGMRKEPAEWFQYWTQLRLKAKADFTDYSHEYEKSGNTEPSRQLCKHTIRICAIFGIYGDGLPINPDVGCRGHSANNELLKRQYKYYSGIKINEYMHIFGDNIPDLLDDEPQDELRDEEIAAEHTTAPDMFFSHSSNNQGRRGDASVRFVSPHKVVQDHLNQLFDQIIGSLNSLEQSRSHSYQQIGLLDRIITTTSAGKHLEQ